MRTWLFLVPLFISGIAIGQEYVYVNAKNLLLRSSPNRDYEVVEIVHPPTRLRVEPYPEPYDRSKAIMARYYYVRLFYYRPDMWTRSCDGWVDKRYLVRSLSAITAPDTDTTLILSATSVRYDQKTAFDFPPPRYKGGSPPMMPVPAMPREYHTGPYGGCFYYSTNRKKVYVDSKYCNGE
jgi:hypothetical protein